MGDGDPIADKSIGHRGLVMGYTTLYMIGNIGSTSGGFRRRFQHTSHLAVPGS